MAKKPRREGGEKPQPQPAAQRQAPAGAAGGGKMTLPALFAWAAALILVILGYFFLTKADPGGRNLWSSLAPAFLLAGYLLFIPAINLSYPSK